MRQLATTIATLTTALAVASLGACKKRDGKGKAAEVPVAVATVTATEHDTPDLLVLTGSVVPDESSDVAADIAGKVVAVMVERGDTVKAGDPLIRLDTRNAQLGAREASANLAAARAQRQLAQDECARAQALFDKGAITKSQYEREQTSCTAALQQVAAAEARTQMITKSIADGIVRAPFDGTIGDRWISPGEWVAPGVRLVTLIDANPLKVELTVPESEVPKIALEQRVVVEAIAKPGQEFAGKVTRIGAEIGRQTRALVVEATLAEGTPLVPGMFVEAQIQTGTRRYPAVAKTAVAKRGQTWRAFVVVDGVVQERVVQIGPEPIGEANMISIVKGVSAREVLVAVVDASTADGARVQATGAPAPAPPTLPTPPTPEEAKVSGPVPGAKPQER
jgi:membrane fusion protein (multidrug efflux system)